MLSPATIQRDVQTENDEAECKKQKRTMSYHLSGTAMV